MRLPILSFFVLFVIQIGNSHASSNYNLKNSDVSIYPIFLMYHQSEMVIDSDQNWKRYLFETAVVKMISKTVQAGIEIVVETLLYIKDYGLSEARYTTTTRNIKMLNRIEVTKDRSIMTKDKLITIKEDGTVHEMDNPGRDLMNVMTEGKEKQFGEGILDALEANQQKAPSEYIAGKKCDCIITTTNVVGMKMEALECNYGKFPFKITSSGMGANTEEIVIEFQEGVQISEEHFTY